MSDIEISMDDILNLTTSKEIVQATSETPPAGNYLAKIISCKLKQVSAESQYNPGRVYFGIFASLHTENDEGGPGDRVGKAFFKMSPVFAKNAKGKPDMQSKLYGEAALALGTDVRDPTALVEAMKSGEAVVSVWGKDSYREEGSWDRQYCDAEEDEKRQFHLDRGDLSEFNVFNIRRSLASNSLI